jgi:CCR4-NOT complex subunit CAF16
VHPIDIHGLHFTYPGATTPVLRDLQLSVPPGARALLIGANGSGKTTLLGLIAGRHMVPDAVIRVLGRPAFSDTSLAGRVAWLGGQFPFDVDIGVDEILARRTCDPARRDQLVELLAVDPRWRMSRVSDGQRRRVQILLGLLDPRELLLLDEVTTDLDVIARADLLAFLRHETEQRGTTILYATHIFDGIAPWATHLGLLEDGAISLFAPVSSFPELIGVADSPLLRLVDRWLRRAAPPAAASGG